MEIYTQGDGADNRGSQSCLNGVEDKSSYENSRRLEGRPDSAQLVDQTSGNENATRGSRCQPKLNEVVGRRRDTKWHELEQPDCCSYTARDRTQQHNDQKDGECPSLRYPVISVDQEGLDDTGRDADSQNTDREGPMLNQNVCY